MTPRPVASSAQFNCVALCVPLGFGFVTVSFRFRQSFSFLFPLTKITLLQPDLSHAYDRLSLGDLQTLKLN